MANTKAIMTALYGDGSSVSSYTPTLREKGVDWLARNWYGDNREGTWKAEKLSNLLETVTPYGMATMGYDAGRALGGGHPVQGAMMAGLAIAPLPASAEKSAAKGIRAYHGSPHSFDKFSLDKIGTGEGAQAYGHGLYFAEHEGTAKGYRDRIAGADWVDKRGVPIQSNTIANDVMEQARKDGLGVLDAQDAANMWSVVAKDGEGAANFPGYESVKKVLDKHGIRLREKGSMYEVRINANPDDFLDWDKPLSEQSDRVRALALGADISAAKGPTAGMMKMFRDGQEQAHNRATGQTLYRAISDYGGNSEIGTKAISEAGIPGIKYLDAGSRGKGDGSRNYVVFDDKLIEIVKKYGIAGASAMLGMDVLANMDEAQASQLQKADNMGKIQKSLLSGGW